MEVEEQELVNQVEIMEQIILVVAEAVVELIIKVVAQAVQV